jgi:thiamine-monophosphate kinase
MDELKFIDHILQQSKKYNLGLQVPADDCAYVPDGKGWYWLFSTDNFVEGSHFKREWMTWPEVGYKTGVEAISDIAAMGGIFQGAMVGLHTPKGFPLSDAQGIQRGINRVLKEYKGKLFGGDTTSGGDRVFINISVIGKVEAKCCKFRKNSRLGDLIAVTGPLGGAQYVLEKLLRSKRKITAAEKQKKSMARFYHPQAQIQKGRILSQYPEVHSLIDISDGLSTDLTHICKASGTGALLDARLIPRYESLRLALASGEEYELLFTVADTAAGRGAVQHAGATVIGKITAANKGIRIIRDGKVSALQPAGFRHK